VTVLVLPDPSLVLFIGAAGSGKSTLAGRWFTPDELLSSDALRAAVSGDEADQRASRAAFRILYREVATRLGAGRLVAVDATNARRDHRRPLLAMAAAHGSPAVAIAIDLPLDVALARNRARARVVDPDVVRRQHEAVRASLAPGRLAAEGVALVAVLRSPEEVAAFRVERSVRPRPTG
jgi:protein phosphatase